MTQLQTYSPFKLKQAMPFGKYQGLKFSDLIKRDPQYFRWLYSEEYQFEDEVFIFYAKNHIEHRLAEPKMDKKYRVVFDQFDKEIDERA